MRTPGAGLDIMVPGPSRRPISPRSSSFVIRSMLPAGGGPGGRRQGSMHEAGHHVAIGAAPPSPAAPGAEHQEAFAIGVRLDLPDQVEIDDGRAVDALETARIEALLEVLHRLAQDQRVVAGIDAHVIAGGVDPLDRVDVDAEDLAAILDVDQLLEAVRRPSRRRRPNRRSRRPASGATSASTSLRLLDSSTPRFSVRRWRTRSSVSASRAGPRPASSDNPPPAPRRRGWHGRYRR